MPTDTPTEDAVVIDLAEHRKELDPEPKIRVLRPSTCFCTFVCDVQTRTVRCPKCSRAWDPFDALLVFGRKTEGYLTSLVRLKQQVQAKTKILEGLTKAVKNLKAQRKRLTEGREA